MIDGVIFLHDDKRQNFLQGDTIFFDRFGQAYSKYPEKFAKFLKFFKKSAKNKNDFLYAVSIKVFRKLILLFLIALVKHPQSTQNSKFQIC